MQMAANTTVSDSVFRAESEINVYNRIRIG